MAIFEHEFTIGMRDVGNSNKISNKAVLGFFEDIGGIHSDVAGFGLGNIEHTKLSWVLLQWKVDILKRANYGDTIVVRTWARESFKFFCYRDFEMFNKTTNELLAHGTSKWALVHIENGLAKIDNSILECYHPENLHVYEQIELSKLKELSTSSVVSYYNVLRSNIDINKHMHNLYYLDVAYEALPLDVYRNCNFSHIEIMYKKECKLGDKLKCFYSFFDDSHFITIKSLDEKILHSIIKLS